MIEASFVTAAGGELPFLQEMVAMFAIASLLVFLCHRLKLVSIVGVKGKEIDFLDPFGAIEAIHIGLASSLKGI